MKQTKRAKAWDNPRLSASLCHLRAFFLNYFSLSRRGLSHGFVHLIFFQILTVPSKFLVEKSYSFDSGFVMCDVTFDRCPHQNCHKAVILRSHFIVEEILQLSYFIKYVVKHLFILVNILGTNNCLYRPYKYSVKRIHEVFIQLQIHSQSYLKIFFFF